MCNPVDEHSGKQRQK